MWIFTERSKTRPHFLSYRFLLCLEEGVGSYTQIKVGLSVHERRLTFIISEFLRCTHRLKVCRYAMKPVHASVQVNRQGPVTAWKERIHTGAMELFIFPRPSSWIFFRILQNFCWSYHSKGWDLCPHTHRRNNSLFSSYPTVLPEHLRSLVNEKLVKERLVPCFGWDIPCHLLLVHDSMFPVKICCQN